MTADTVQHEEPSVGMVPPAVPFEVTEALLDDYYRGLALDRPAEATVPSMVAGAADNFHRWSAFSQDCGHLWMRQEWDPMCAAGDRELVRRGWAHH